MIINLWSKIQLICGNHSDGDEEIMTPHEAASSKMSRSLYGNSSMNMFYSCPKYYPENRKDDAPCCRNHISMKEFEGMLTYLSKTLEDAQLNGGTMDLTGLKWKSKSGVEYHVISYSDSAIRVKCLNKRALWN